MITNDATYGLLFDSILWIHSIYVDNVDSTYMSTMWTPYIRKHCKINEKLKKKFKPFRRSPISLSLKKSFN